MLVWIREEEGIWIKREVDYQSKEKPEVVVRVLYDLLNLKGKQWLSIATTVPQKYNLMIYFLSEQKVELVQETFVETLAEVEPVLLKFDESQKEKENKVGKEKLYFPTTFTFSRSLPVSSNKALPVKAKGPLAKTPSVLPVPSVSSVKPLSAVSIPVAVSANQIVVANSCTISGIDLSYRLEEWRLNFEAWRDREALARERLSLPDQVNSFTDFLEEKGLEYGKLDSENQDLKQTISLLQEANATRSQNLSTLLNELKQEPLTGGESMDSKDEDEMIGQIKELFTKRAQEIKSCIQQKSELSERNEQEKLDFVNQKTAIEKELAQQKELYKTCSNVLQNKGNCEQRENDLNSQLSLFNATNLKLEAELTEMKKKLSVSEGLNQEYQRILQKNTKERETCDASLASCTASKNKPASVRTVEVKDIQCEKTLSSLEQELASQTAQRDARIDTLQIENNELRAQNVQKTQIIERIEQKTLATQAKQSVAQKLKNEEVTKQITALTLSNNGLQSERAKITEQNGRLSALVPTLQKERAVLVKTIEELKKQIQKLESKQAEEAKRESDDELTRLGNQVKSLTDQIKAKQQFIESEREACKRNIEDLKSKAASCKTKKGQKDVEIDELKSKVINITELKSRISSLETELEKNTTAISQCYSLMAGLQTKASEYDTIYNAIIKQMEKEDVPENPSPTWLSSIIASLITSNNELIEKNETSLDDLLNELDPVLKLIEQTFDQKKMHIQTTLRNYFNITEYIRKNNLYPGFDLKDNLSYFEKLHEDWKKCFAEKQAPSTVEMKWTVQKELAEIFQKKTKQLEDRLQNIQNLTKSILQDFPEAKTLSIEEQLKGYINTIVDQYEKSVLLVPLFGKPNEEDTELTAMLQTLAVQIQKHLFEIWKQIPRSSWSYGKDKEFLDLSIIDELLLIEGKVKEYYPVYRNSL